MVLYATDECPHSVQRTPTPTTVHGICPDWRHEFGCVRLCFSMQCFLVVNHLPYRHENNVKASWLLLLIQVVVVVEGGTNHRDIMLILCLCIVSLLTLFTTRYAIENQWQHVTATPSSSSTSAATLWQSHSQSETQPEKPLLHQLAPFIFPMNARTGMIDLPAEIETVLIDVGARESDYLRLLEERANRSPTATQIIRNASLPSMPPWRIKRDKCCLMLGLDRHVLPC